MPAFARRLRFGMRWTSEASLGRRGALDKAFPVACSSRKWGARVLVGDPGQGEEEGGVRQYNANASFPSICFDDSMLPLKDTLIVPSPPVHCVSIDIYPT